jgi:hypothetical protein
MLDSTGGNHVMRYTPLTREQEAMAEDAIDEVTRAAPADLHGIHRTFALPGSADWNGTVAKAELIDAAEREAHGIVDIAAARERRELDDLFEMDGPPRPKR